MARRRVRQADRRPGAGLALAPTRASLLGSHGDMIVVSPEHGNADTEFWRSIFRYRSGSGPAVMTGWANVLFPYLKDEDDKLYKNPYLSDWRERFAVSERQTPREWWQDPQGVGIGAIPSCFTSAPLKVFWGSQEARMRLVGGLMGVTQDDQSSAVEPECRWTVIYEEPVDPLSCQHQRLEEFKQRLNKLREWRPQ